MGWKHFRLLILHFKFQFSKSIKSSTFHIIVFLNLTYPFEVKYLFPKMSKNHQKFTQNRPTVVSEISREM